MGMNRTGIFLDQIVPMYEKCSKLAGIRIRGMHGYDGHHHNPDLNVRSRDVQAVDLAIASIRTRLVKQGYDCSILVLGGTPSLPCHAQHTRDFLSPGTAFIGDMGYYENLPDLPFVPGAAILTRVISHPDQGILTIDLGHKGISSDPVGVRGVIINLDHYQIISQSEEHWVLQMEAGYEDRRPPIGSVLYAVPTHICPTTALYASALIARQGDIVDEWEVTARNRKINY
jgi:D-threonine aldolase